MIDQPVYGFDLIGAILALSATAVPSDRQSRLLEIIAKVLTETHRPYADGDSELLAGQKHLLCIFHILNTKTN